MPRRVLYESASRLSDVHRSSPVVRDDLKQWNASDLNRPPPFVNLAAGEIQQRMGNPD